MDALAKFKIKKSDIFITLHSEESFDKVLEEFVDKLQDAAKVFKNAKANVYFTGRDLSEEEETAVFDAIEKSGLNLVIYGEEMVLESPMPIFTEEEPEELTKDLQQEYDPQYQKTFFQNGSLRSGRRIEYDGSVVLLGDLNAGAEIIAKGNVVILGACRGMVHAGSSGDVNSYIFAQHLTPTQIRIGEIVTYLNKDKNEEKHPSYVYVDNGKIFVAKI